MNRQTNY